MSDEKSERLVREIKRVRGATIVVLAGELDMRYATVLSEVLTQVAAERPPRLILNLSQVQYMDSTGVGTLIHILRKVNAYNGKMALVGVRPEVRKVFEITKLLHVFAVYDNDEDAIKA